MGLDMAPQVQSPPQYPKKKEVHNPSFFSKKIIKQGVWGVICASRAKQEITPNDNIQLGHLRIHEITFLGSYIPEGIWC